MQLQALFASLRPQRLLISDSTADQLGKYLEEELYGTETLRRAEQRKAGRYPAGTEGSGRNTAAGWTFEGRAQADGDADFCLVLLLIQRRVQAAYCTRVKLLAVSGAPV